MVKEQLLLCYRKQKFLRKMTRRLEQIDAVQSYNSFLSNKVQTDE